MSPRTGGKSGSGESEVARNFGGKLKAGKRQGRLLKKTPTAYPKLDARPKVGPHGEEKGNQKKRVWLGRGKNQKGPQGGDNDERGKATGGYGRAFLGYGPDGRVLDFPIKPPQSVWAAKNRTLVLDGGSLRNIWPGRPSFGGTSRAGSSGCLFPSSRTRSRTRYDGDNEKKAGGTTRKEKG